jgi:hypothetical protein
MTTTRKLTAYIDRDRPTAAPVAVQPPTPNPGSRAGQVPIQIWVSKADRLRLKKLALDQEEPLQAIVLRGLNLALKAKGLDPLKEVMGS